MSKMQRSGETIVSAFSAGSRWWLKRWNLRPLYVAVALLLLCAVVSMSSPVPLYKGRVLDASTSAPLDDAIVTLGNLEVRTNHDGTFEINGSGDSIGFRAYGYKRASLPAAEFKTGRHDVTLIAFRPKALYLSFFGIGSAKLRESAIGLIDTAHLNAVVIDVKSDRGMVAYQSSVAVSQQVGAQRITTIRDPKEPARPPASRTALRDCADSRLQG